MISKADREAKRRYEASPLGRETKRRYQGSAKGLETYRRYRDSPLGHERDARARRGPKYFETQRRYEAKRAGTRNEEARDRRLRNYENPDHPKYDPLKAFNLIGQRVRWANGKRELKP
jgi:hypothetical protein